jgi:hypothetical protein
LGNRPEFSSLSFSFGTNLRSLQFMQRALLKEIGITTAILGVCMAVIYPVRATLFEQNQQVKEKDDSYPLPPPSQMRLATLGYDAAAADMIWAYLLVSQGLHFSEKRKFENAARYFETIFELDSTYRDPYLMLDVILTFGNRKANEQDARRTKKLFELGVQNRPMDAKLLYQVGSYLAYIGPGYLKDPEEIKQWELEGAKLLTRSAELGVGEDALQHHGLAGAAVLTRMGQRQAAVDFYERVYGIMEDEESRALIREKLRRLHAESVIEGSQSALKAMETTWRYDLPFVPRARYLLLGPPVPVWKCAGATSFSRPECAYDWPTWTKAASKRANPPGQPKKTSPAPK